MLRFGRSVAIEINNHPEFPGDEKCYGALPGVHEKVNAAKSRPEFYEGQWKDEKRCARDRRREWDTWSEKKSPETFGTLLRTTRREDPSYTPKSCPRVSLHTRTLLIPRSPRSTPVCQRRPFGVVYKTANLSQISKTNTEPLVPPPLLFMHFVFHFLFLRNKRNQDILPTYINLQHILHYKIFHAYSSKIWHTFVYHKWT